MPDLITLLRKIPEGVETRWADMGDGTHALVVYIGDGLVQLADNDGNPLSVDNEGALTVISYPHHEIHSGSMYEAAYKSPEASDIADNANLDILIQVGAARTNHTVFDVSAGGDCEVFLYEGTTTSDVGTAMSEVNLNRASTRTSGTTVTHTPTVSAVGVQLTNYWIPGGTGPKSGGGGSTPRPGTEWIFDKGETYLIRTTNRAGAAKPVGVVIEWYEEG